MVKVLQVRRQGSQLKVYLDDGTHTTVNPTTNVDLWKRGGSAGGGVVIPPPPVGGGNFSWPFDPNVYESSPYGPRQGGAGSFHEGTDLAPSRGTPIPAAGSGVVEERYYHSAFGNMAIIFHGTIGGYDLRTLYAHMENPALVGLGSPITKGTIIGTVGSTGGAFGPHLHLETHQSAIGAGITWNLVNNGGYRTAINPHLFFTTYA